MFIKMLNKVKFLDSSLGACTIFAIDIKTAELSYDNDLQNKIKN